MKEARRAAGCVQAHLAEPGDDSEVPRQQHHCVDHGTLVEVDDRGIGEGDNDEPEDTPTPSSTPPPCHRRYDRPAINDRLGESVRAGKCGYPVLLRGTAPRGQIIP